MIFFDHIEIHVSYPLHYCEFLTALFCGGRFKKISTSEIYMFISNDCLRFEIKQLKGEFIKQDRLSGFCMPCIRTKGAKEHLANLNVTIISEMQDPDGPCIFFEDYEGIKWHIKSYDILDASVNF